MHSIRRVVVAGALTVGMCGVPAVITTAQATAASSTSATRAAANWPLVQKGDTGGRVRAIQYLLNARGAKLTVDGNFGTATQNAVKAFQKKIKMPAVGWVGPKTWPKLIITVKSGSTGSAVSAVQWQLRNEYGFTKLSVDGKFGSATQTAVKSFQKKYKLTQDGIVGNNTWMALEVNHK
jgi:peptidoglycan hydrolase-like protein with peptidoglycan-binding domain